MLDRMAHSEYGEGFVEVSDERQEFLLAAVQHGNVRWEGPEPVRWFEELLSEATELYIANAKWVSHPQNQAAATQREGESPDRKLPAA
jgi:hypothetical protein